MDRKKISMGVDVGGTNIKFGITDEDGNVLSRYRIRTETGEGSDGIIDSITENMGVALSQAGLKLSDIGSLGLGVPGTTDSKNGVVVFAPNLFWKNVEIVRRIRQVYDIPVYVAQDTRASAWAEYLVGAAKGLTSVASITLGTGIGCGIVIDGRIYHGGLNTAGEFGHQIVEVNGNPCNCGRFGCLEAHAAGLAIVRAAKKGIGNISDLLKKKAEDISVDDVYRLAQQGNARALEITKDVVKYVGIGLVNLININSHQLVSISGGISNAPDELLFRPLVEFVRARVYETISTTVIICKSPLGDDAPMIGAALLYRQEAD
jgi:glucokinase